MREEERRARIWRRSPDRTLRQVRVSWLGGSGFAVDEMALSGCALVLM